MVSLWAEGKHPEALILAKKLAIQHPKNGDVFCALGKANLQVSPSNFVEADKALSRAVELGCERNELLSLITTAKRGTTDWKGLRAYTATKFSRIHTVDVALDAYLFATDKLMERAFGGGKYSEASEYALEAVKKISQKLARQSLSQEYFQELCKTQNRFANEYVRSIELDNPRDRDQLAVLNAISDVFDLNVTLPQLALKASKALIRWFADVCKKPVLDNQVLDILKQKIIQMRRIHEKIKQKKSIDASVLQTLETEIRNIEFRGAKLRADQ